MSRTVSTNSITKGNENISAGSYCFVKAIVCDVDLGLEGAIAAWLEDLGRWPSPPEPELWRSRGASRGRSWQLPRQERPGGEAPATPLTHTHTDFSWLVRNVREIDLDFLSICLFSFDEWGKMWVWQHGESLLRCLSSCGGCTYCNIPTQHKATYHSQSV